MPAAVIELLRARVGHDVIRHHRGAGGLSFCIRRSELSIDNARIAVAPYPLYELGSGVGRKINADRWLRGGRVGFCLAEA